MKRLLVALAILGIASPLWAAAPGRETMLQEADRAYRESRYQSAYDGYAAAARNR